MPRNATNDVSASDHHFISKKTFLTLELALLTMKFFHSTRHQSFPPQQQHSLQTVITLLLGVLIVLACFGSVMVSADRRCYINSPAGSGVIQYTFTDTGIVCVRYGFKCQQNDTSCTPSEIAQGTIKKVYTGVTQSTCDVMKSSPTIYIDTYCCNTDLCNGDSTNDGVSLRTTTTTPQFHAMWLMCTLVVIVVVFVNVLIH